MLFPARVIDPKSGDVIAYIDPVSRQRFHTWPPPPGADLTPRYYDFKRNKTAEWKPLTAAQRRRLEEML